MIQSLFLDLDDTIYPTKSLGVENFEGFFTLLRTHNDSVSPDQLNKAIEQMWINPIHVVAQKYGFSRNMYERSMQFFHKPDFTFDIRPFNDFHRIVELNLPMYLVTTGPVQLQEPKIDSLGIRHLFYKIIIDDPIRSNGGKVVAFQSLLDEFGLKPESVLVIGDNPESEIKAADILGIPSVLIDRKYKHQRSVRSFDQLCNIHFD